MKRRGTAARPVIPEWVAEMREGCWEWLDEHGYDVFDLNDRQLELRADRRGER